MSEIIDITLSQPYIDKVNALRQKLLELPVNQVSYRVKLLALITDDLAVLTQLVNVLENTKVTL